MNDVERNLNPDDHHEVTHDQDFEDAKGDYLYHCKMEDEGPPSDIEDEFNEALDVSDLFDIDEENKIKEQEKDNESN